jgi:hypothetical protein
MQSTPSPVTAYFAVISTRTVSQYARHNASLSFANTTVGNRQLANRGTPNIIRSIGGKNDCHPCDELSARPLLSQMRLDCSRRCQRGKPCFRWQWLCPIHMLCIVNYRRLFRFHAFHVPSMSKSANAGAWRRLVCVRGSIGAVRRNDER